MRTRAADPAPASGAPHRLSAALGALGWIWACAASAYLLVAANGGGIWSSDMFVGAGDTGRILPSLTTAAGVWTTAVLAGMTLVAAIPVGVSFAHPSDRRRATWPAALTLLGFSLVARASLGWAFLPSAALLAAAACLGDLEAVPAPRTPLLAPRKGGGYPS